MSNKTIQIAFRVPPELVARIDAHAERLSAGKLAPSRSDAGRDLLIRGLEVVEAEDAAKKK